MLTQKRLKELLRYDHKTGVFTWIVSSPRTRADNVAGAKNIAGYLTVSIDGKRHRLHRLAFLYMEGYTPEYQVDHVNGIREDNKWTNLRHVTQACNAQNRRRSRNNKSGFIGVAFIQAVGKWRAQITVDYKVISLGMHEDKVSAALARCEFEKCCDKWECNSQAVNFVSLRSLGFKV